MNVILLGILPGFILGTLNCYEAIWKVEWLRSGCRRTLEGKLVISGRCRPGTWKLEYWVNCGYGAPYTLQRARKPWNI
jgi:hypothetical protein